MIPARKHREKIEWLMPTRHNAKHEEASNRWRHTETCSWILEDWKFQQWRSDGGFLWLHGIRAYFSQIPSIFVIDRSSSWERQDYVNVSRSQPLASFNSYSPSLDLK